MQIRFPFAIAATVVLGLTAGVPLASAETDSTPPEQQAGELNVNTQTLKTFADATREVNQIDADYQPRMESAASPQEREQIEGEATGKMVEAVERKGLTVDQYNQIALLAQVQPNVAEQIVQYMQQPD